MSLRPTSPLPTLPPSLPCLPRAPAPAAPQAVKLVIKVLSKTMDSTSLSSDKVELATLSRDEADGKVSRTQGLRGGVIALSPCQPACQPNPVTCPPNIRSQYVPTTPPVYC